jgi:hypothetical protein
MSEFKVGDKVKLVSMNGRSFGDWEDHMLETGKIVEVKPSGYRVRWNDGFHSSSLTDQNLIFSDKKDRENEMRELKKSKFMVYGTGCDNKSRLFESKKEATEYAKEVVYDNDWTGNIIIYELKPLNIAEKSIKLKTIK